MEQGVGLVCLHQATSLPEGDTAIPLTDWLGACRYGMIDRANEMCDYTQRHADSPVCRGWSSFSYKDEIYPTLRFVPGLTGVTPLITAIAPPEKPAEHTVAWTYERSGGGRSFGFTGLHYVASMRVEPVRRMVLNGILWTAHVEIRAGGADSPALRGEMTNHHLETPMHPHMPRCLAFALPVLLLLSGCDGDSRTAADAPAGTSVVVHRGEDKVPPQTWASSPGTSPPTSTARRP